MNLSRRSFLTGLGGALAAPAVIRIPGLLMPIKALAVPEYGFKEYALGYAIVEEEFSTANLLVKSYERFAMNYDDWRGVYGRAGL